VTREELRNLVKHDTRETFRFYTHGIDFASLKSLPRYKRYPAIAWQVFTALAYRLSPARRFAFSAAIFAFLFGWIKLLSFNPETPSRFLVPGSLWLFFAFAVIFLLLLVELRDKLDLKGDLEIAREIQFGLVPSGPFHQNSIGIHCYMRPANTVGGDYYDIIELENDRIAIVVADVAGKGMPAALLMALLQGSLHTLLTAGHRGADVMEKLNIYLCSNIPANSLVTLFYGELDTVSGDLVYVNAGHNAPILIHDAENLERLHSTALVLGIDPKLSFETRLTRIGGGERLLLYTDGISEAFNAREEEYGDARVAAFLQAHTSLPSSELIQQLVDDALKFCGAARIKDDMTLMAVAREG
jgi:serine phosphatase RsbU (regulator of sigma subunit)